MPCTVDTVTRAWDAREGKKLHFVWALDSHLPAIPCTWACCCAEQRIARSIAMSQLLVTAYEAAAAWFIKATEAGVMPDFILRAGIRYLLSLRAKAAVRQPSPTRDEPYAYLRSLRCSQCHMRTAWPPGNPVL